MKVIIALGVLLVALPAAFADQPAVSITKPSQGSKWKVGDKVPTTISWPNTDKISYTNIGISLVEYVGDPSEQTKLLQTICPKGKCPAIKNGQIKLDWTLSPDVIYFGQATIRVTANWQAEGSPVIDTLTQTLTILIVCPDGSTPNDSGACPTPTKKPTATAKVCPGGVPPVNGKCPTPTKKATKSAKPSPTAKVCPGGVPPVDGKCPTPTKKPSKPTPSAKPCPGGVPPVDGKCPTPSPKPTKTAKGCPGGVPPVDGKCPTPTKKPSKPSPTTEVCPDGQPKPPGGVCEGGAGTCPDGSPIPPGGDCVCPDGSPIPPNGACPASALKCVLTQIGSDDFLCPKDQPYGICCGTGICAAGTPATHKCCGEFSCPFTSNCCGESCCPVGHLCCNSVCCGEGQYCKAGVCSDTSRRVGRL